MSNHEQITKRCIKNTVADRCILFTKVFYWTQKVFGTVYGYLWVNCVVKILISKTYMTVVLGEKRKK